MVSALLAFWPRPAGARRSLAFGIALALFTMCFRWLERLPLRPGIGVAVLVGLAVAGALPLAAAADRGEPWFDYQGFAEGLGPKDPIRFDWEHGDYGPVTWSRTGGEVIRVRASRPEYWKVRTLDEFDGTSWDSGGFDRASDDPTLDLPPNWDTMSRFEDRIAVSIQRLRGPDVVGAGTTLDVRNSP